MHVSAASLLIKAPPLGRQIRFTASGMAKGDAHWRYLFLTCGRGFKPEKMSSQYAQARKMTSNSSFFEKLRQPSDEMASEHASKLSARFNLGSLRASKGVLVYLKTRSAKAMSEALGHEEFRCHLNDARQRANPVSMEG